MVGVLAVRQRRRFDLIRESEALARTFQLRFGKAEQRLVALRHVTDQPIRGAARFVGTLPGQHAQPDASADYESAAPRLGDTNEWELKLDLPVNSVLPVGKTYYMPKLEKVLGSR